MRPILLALAALVLPALFADTAEARFGFRRNVSVERIVVRQPVVRERIVVQKQFVAPPVQYVPVRQQAAVYVQPQPVVAYAQPVVAYAQPVVAKPVYAQAFVAPQQGYCQGCNNGGLQFRQQQTGCASLFVQ